MNIFLRTRKSIIFRYIIIIGTLLISAQLLYGLFVAFSNFSQQRADLQQKSVSRAKFLSAVSPDNILSNNFYPLETLIRETDVDPDFVYSIITDSTGRALTTYLNGDDPYVKEAVEKATANTILSRVDFMKNQATIIEVNNPIIIEGTLIGSVRLGYTTENLDTRFGESIGLLLFSATVFGVLLAGGTAILFYYQIRKPLFELSLFASELASGQLDQRTMINSDNEIGQLQLSMNHMAKQLQDTLDELNMLSHVASRTKNMVIISDPFGKIEWVNDAFVLSTEYILDEVKGQAPGSILQGESSDKETVAYMRKQLHAGEGFYVEIINYTKSGKQYWVSVEVQPVIDQTGNLTNFIAIETDITERKKAEEQLSQYAKDMEIANKELFLQQAQLQSLLEIATQSHSIEDQLQRVVKQGAQNLNMEIGLISNINKGSYVITESYSTHYPIERGMTCSLEDTLCKRTVEHNQILAYHTLETMGENVPQAFEGLLIQSYIGVPLIIDDEVIGTLSFMSQLPHPNDFTNSEYDYISMMAQWVNVTLERQVSSKNLMEYAEELERSNRELQDFAYIASHDLQEPLRKIQAFGSRIESKYSDVLDERGLDYLQRMQNAANRMQSLINDLLAFSRVASEAKPFKDVVLEDVLKGVLSDLEVRIEQSQGQIEVQELMTIHADALQIRQIFQNIIGNALKFSYPERTPIIHISCDTVEIEDRTYCEVKIADNGVGFDQKYSDKIFGIFQRLHGKNEYEGTGVGLAICKKIIERHNGFIHAESKLDVGTTFIIQLPVKQENNTNE